MDRTRERLTTAGRALASLREVALLTAPTAVERDAAIQRFEYSFEATWKAAQRFLADREGIDAGSPKAAIRASREAGLFDDAQAADALAMADDRNLTVHAYNEALARAIFVRLAAHVALLERWLAEMRSRLADPGECAGASRRQLRDQVPALAW